MALHVALDGEVRTFRALGPRPFSEVGTDEPLQLAPPPHKQFRLATRARACLDCFREPPWRRREVMGQARLGRISLPMAAGQADRSY